MKSIHDALCLADALIFEAVTHKLEVLNDTTIRLPEDHSKIVGASALDYLIYAERYLRGFDADYSKRNRKLHTILLDNLTDLSDLFSTYQERWISDDWVSLPYGANNFALPRNKYGSGIFVFYDGELDAVYEGSDMPNILFRAATYAYETRQRLYFACHRLTRSAHASCSAWHARQGLDVLPIFIEGTRLNRPANKHIHRILGSSEINGRISEMCGYVESVEIEDGRIKLYRGIKSGN